jgi:hypothetical protein
MLPDEYACVLLVLSLLIVTSIPTLPQSGNYAVVFLLLRPQFGIMFLHGRHHTL